MNSFKTPAHTISLLDSWNVLGKRANTYRAADDEQPLLFFLDPLSNPNRTLDQCVSVCIWLGNTVELVDWSYPSE